MRGVCVFFGETQEALALFRTELTKAFEGFDLDPVIEITLESPESEASAPSDRSSSTRSSMLKLLRIWSKSLLIFGLITAADMAGTSHFSS